MEYGIVDASRRPYRQHETTSRLLCSFVCAAGSCPCVVRCRGASQPMCSLWLVDCREQHQHLRQAAITRMKIPGGGLWAVVSGRRWGQTSSSLSDVPGNCLHVYGRGVDTETP